MNLGKVKARTGFIGNQYVPLEIVGFDFLQVSEHFLFGVGLRIEGVDNVLQVTLVLLLYFD